MLPVIPTARAVEDLVELTAYLMERSPDAGIRFHNSVAETFRQLSESPELGAVYRFRRKSITNIRIWRVKKFTKYLIFYRVYSDRIVIVRVRHGATNYMDFFDE